MSDALHRARLATGEAVLAERLRPAHTHWTRLRGLLGTASLPAGEGLWLKPCRRIHMFGMRYAVDAVFLDDAQRIVRVLPDLGPGHVSPRVDAAASVLELPAGTAARIGLAEGAQVVIEGEPAERAGGRPSRLGTALCNLALAALYTLFVVAHVTRPGRGPIDLSIIVQESILVVLFVARHPSTDTSDRPLDWVLGMLGTFLPMLVRPTERFGWLAWIGVPMQVLGMSAAAVAVLFLGRSFGIVAANRGVKLGGAYRVVRHPMYTAYLLGYAGYLLTYPSHANVLILIAAAFCLNARAIAEERILGRDPAYREYLHRLPWRFFPFLY